MGNLIRVVLSHLIKHEYHKGWESDGRKPPILREKYGCQFSGTLFIGWVLLYLFDNYGKLDNKSHAFPILPSRGYA